MFLSILSLDFKAQASIALVCTIGKLRRPSKDFQSLFEFKSLFQPNDSTDRLALLPWNLAFYARALLCNRESFLFTKFHLD